MKPSDLISDPSKWTRGAWARDAEGYSCEVMDPEAVRWDAIGAVCRTRGITLGEAYALFAARLGKTNVTETNDLRGREAAVEMLREAGL